MFGPGATVEELVKALNARLTPRDIVPSRAIKQAGAMQAELR